MRAVRPSRRVLSAKTAAGLFTAALALAPFLLAAPRADAAAYYVGGGKGVRLAVRVVDRQIVWAKVRVRENCLGSERGYYHHTNSYEGLAGTVPIGGKGGFSWKSGYKNLGHKGDEEVSVENISGRVGPRRLVARVLYYGWFTSSEPPGTHRHGHCWGASGPRPAAHPVPVRTTALRRPEPTGTSFYFSAKEEGIGGYFEVQGRRILRAQVSVRLYCTGPHHGRWYFSSEAPSWRAPIRIGPSGTFEEGTFESLDPDIPYEVLRGEVGPRRITGSYGYAYGYENGRHCRTGSFEPGHGRSWAVPFVAPRR